jgi:EPS-associated MarR family transcriptional regulator
VSASQKTSRENPSPNPISTKVGHSCAINAARNERELRVMFELVAIPDLTQRELACRVGVSVGAINYCVNSLIDKGFIKLQNFAHSKNKFGYAYILTPKGLAQKSKLTKLFLALKVDEYQRLKKEIDKLETLVANDHSKKDLSY